MTTELDLLHILRSSFALLVLLFCSVLMVTVIVERWWSLRRAEVDVDGFLDRIRKFVEEDHHKEAMALCDSHPGPIPGLVGQALLNRHKTRAYASEIMNAHRLEARLKLEKHLIVLGTLGNSAPFIGLFGTVVGIIKAFRDLALAGTGGPTIVAAGIAEALVATAAGLAVAIPASIFYNYFMKRVQTMAVQMESVQIRILTYLGLV